MELQRPHFLFYLFWISAFVLVSITLIFILDYYNVLRILRRDPGDILSINLDQTKKLDEGPDLMMQQFETKSIPAEPPVYFRNKNFDGDAMFLNDSGTSFQVGYLNIEALFPDDFNTEDEYLPLQFQGNGNVIRVEFRIGIGWNSLPPINELVVQSTNNNSIRVSSLKAIQFQFRIIQNLEPSVNKRIQRSIQSEIHKVLRENRLPVDLVNEAIRILGIRYTQRGLENISLEYIP